MDDMRFLTELLDFTQYLDNPTYTNIIDEVANTTMSVVMLKLAPLIAAIAISMAVYRFYTENKRAGVDIPEMIRIFVLLVLAWSSVQMTSGVSTIINGVIAQFNLQQEEDLDDFYKMNIVQRVKDHHDLSDQSAAELLHQLTGSWSTDSDIVKDYVDKLSKSETDEEGKGITSMLDGGFIKKTIDRIKDMMQNSIKTSLTGNAMFLMLLSKIVMSMLIFAFSSILQVFAPLAFVFSIVFKGTAVKWFKTFLVTKFTFVSFMIIEAIFLTWIANISSQAVSGITDSFQASEIYLLVGLSLTSVICYVSAFWLTSTYIGSHQAGQFMSQASGIALAGVNKGINTIRNSLKNK